MYDTVAGGEACCDAYMVTINDILQSTTLTD